MHQLYLISSLYREKSLNTIVHKFPSRLFPLVDWGQHSYNSSRIATHCTVGWALKLLCSRAIIYFDPPRCNLLPIGTSILLTLFLPGTAAAPPSHDRRFAPGTTTPTPPGPAPVQRHPPYLELTPHECRTRRETATGPPRDPTRGLATPPRYPAGTGLRIAMDNLYIFLASSLYVYCVFYRPCFCYNS